MKLKQKTEIISKALTPALKFWLRSQLDHVEDLDINIHAGDTQIIKGKINHVSLNTNYAVYQGIHVGKVAVETENIKINLGEIVRGKPLKLLQAIFVKGELAVTENQLNTSLSSSLLAQGLVDLIILLLEEKELKNAEKILADYEITWENLTLNPDKFILNGTIKDKNDNSNSLMISSGLELYNNQTLLLDPIYIEGIPEIEKFSLNKFTVDLGEDVELEKLSLQDEQLYCVGKVKINN